MLNSRHLQAAVRFCLAGVFVLLFCACLVCLYQSRAGFAASGRPFPLSQQGSLCFSALVCAGVAGVCARSFFVAEDHPLASSQSMPWLLVGSGVALVLCLASLVGNAAMQHLFLNR